MEYSSESSVALSQCKSSPYFKIGDEKSTNSATGTSNKVFTDVTQENELKSSQITSSLDRFCRNDLNESADFIDCDSKTKFKKKKDKTDLFHCEICKESITHLDIYERGVHVNNCIDKQISSTTASAIQPSETENIFILECPLCFKNFSSPELRTNHIKKCGKSKGLGTQAMLKALELQERHALERVALGLPSKPLKPIKSHKSAANKKVAVEPKNKAQSDIQLAKAMSLSLTDTQQPQVNAVREDISVPVVLQAPTVQQNPGKKISKHRKGLMGTPLLVLRSDEDRKKILLDKVAAILAPVEEANDAATAEQSVTSVETKKDPKEVPVLWHLSSKSSEKWDYYVVQLLDWIVPSNVEVGAKLGHLSQIAGHEIHTQLPLDYTFSSQDKSHTSEIDQPVPSVIGCLQSLVASSWMSDVDIHTSCGTVLPAHKLLLAIRCPPLKQDLNFCTSSGKAILKWENVSFNAALQFLNFVYTGHLEQDETIVSDLLDLAKKYEVHDLEVFLNGNGKSQSPGVASNCKFYQDTNDYPTSLLTNSPKIQPGLFYKSQEDMNTDLEIVCNCISSSLQPTPSTSPQQPISSTCMKCPEFSPKSVLKDNPNSPIVVSDDSNELQSNKEHEMQMTSKSFSEGNCFSRILDEDINDLHIENNHEVQMISKPFSAGYCTPPIAEEDSNALYIDEDHEVQMVSKPCSQDNPASPLSCEDVSQLIRDSPEKSASSDVKPSHLFDKCLSASPVIFDVNDSEDDMLDEENDQIGNSYSQNSENRESDGRFEELDVNSAESNSSGDSVKILKSSYLSLSAVQKEHDEVRRISKCLGSSQCSNVTRLAASPQKETYSTADSSEDLQKLSSVQKEHDQVRIISKCLGSSQCSNATRLAASPQKETYSTAYSSEDLQKLGSNRWDSENVSYKSSTIYSGTKFESFNCHESSTLHLNSLQFNIDKVIESSSKFDNDNLKVSCNSSPVNFNKRKLDESENISAKNMKLGSPYKKDTFQMTSSLFVNELSGYDELDSTLAFPSCQKSPLKNKQVKNVQVSSNPAKIYSIQIKKSLTEKELGDYDEVANDRLLLTSSQKSPVEKKLVNNAETSNSPSKYYGVHIMNNSIDKKHDSYHELCDGLLLPASQKSSVLPSAKHDYKEYSPKRRNILPEILFCDSDSVLLPQSNSKDFPENSGLSNISITDEVERIRKNIASPEVICFSSDNEAFPLDESSSFRKKLPSNIEGQDKTPAVAENSSERIKSYEIDSPKLLNMSYQSMDDFVFEEPYADFEPDFPSPEKEMEKHYSTFSDAYSSRNGTAKDDTVQREPIEQSEPNTSPKKATASQLQLVNKAEKKTQSKVSEQSVTPSNKTGCTIAPKFYFTDSPITPLPDFRTMKTPDIKQALKRFGVKAMPRKKAVALLSHIYNETHPLVNGETETSSTATPSKQLAKEPVKCKKRKLLSENSKKPAKKAATQKVLAPKGILLSSDSDDSSSENPEAIRLGCIPEISSSQCTQSSPTKDGDVIEKIKKYILSSDRLHTDILMYRPLNIAAFQQELKGHDIKISIPKLMDHFDDQGITFTYPRNEEKQKKRTARANNFRKRMITKMSQQPS